MVLKDETHFKDYKFGIAMKFVKQKYTTFKSEEKRRVMKNVFFLTIAFEVVLQWKPSILEDK